MPISRAILKAPRSVLLLIVLLGFLVIRPASAVNIDVMIVYDTTAASWVTGEGGTGPFALDVVNRMNQVTQNSGLDLTYHLVHTMTASYTYSGSLETDLQRIQAGSSGFGSVHTARDAYAADLVILLVDTGSAFGYVGLAYVMTSWQGHAPLGYSANSVRSAAISHVVTHEVGHNLGADHARNQVSPGPNIYLDNQYSAGSYFTGADDGIGYHTIMAYNRDRDHKFFQLAPLFSTPEQLYKNTPAGDSTSDNVRLMRQTKSVVAGYRTAVAQQPPERPASITYPETSVTGSFVVSWPASSAATSYRLARSANAGATWTDVYAGSEMQYDETLVASGSYRYRVLAANDLGSSLWQVGTRDIVVTLETTPAPDPDNPIYLDEGESLTDLSGALGSVQYFAIAVPEAATRLLITTSAGTGDVDLYVRYGSVPVPDQHDCFSISIGNSDSCFFETPQSGTYYIVLYAYADYAGVTLRITYDVDVPSFDREPASWRVAEIYLATLGYAPDSEGLDYWVKQILLVAAWTPETVAQSFFDDPLVAAQYPSELGYTRLIEALYQNLFGRDPDAEGLSYWQEQLESGTMQRNEIIIALINGGWANVNAARDMIRFGNRITVALAFVEQQRVMGISYSDLNLEQQAELRRVGSLVVTDVTEDPATVPTAIDTIPDLLQLVLDS